MRFKILLIFPFLLNISVSNGQNINSNLIGGMIVYPGKSETLGITGKIREQMNRIVSKLKSYGKEIEQDDLQRFYNELNMVELELRKIKEIMEDLVDAVNNKDIKQDNTSKYKIYDLIEKFRSSTSESKSHLQKIASMLNQANGLVEIEIRQRHN